MHDVGQEALGRVEVITTNHASKSRHSSQSGAIQVQRHGQVQVHRLLFAGTEDNNKRSLVQWKETVRAHHHDGEDQPREEGLWRAHVGQGLILGLPEAVVRLLA